MDSDEDTNMQDVESAPLNSVAKGKGKAVVDHDRPFDNDNLPWYEWCPLILSMLWNDTF